jgi:hypothetical protein
VVGFHILKMAPRAGLEPATLRLTVWSRDDGRYIIRRWRATDGALLPIDGHEESYDEEEMDRRLNVLRATGDTYVREDPTTARLIQP